MQKTSFQTAIVKRENISGAEIKIWALDYPAHERLVDFGQALLRIQGWVLWSDPLKMVPELIVAVNGVTVHTQAFNTKRPDVVERVLHERAENHVQLCCLFITLKLVIICAIASMFEPFEPSDSMCEVVCALYCLGHKNHLS